MYLPNSPSRSHSAATGMYVNGIEFQFPNQEGSGFTCPHRPVGTEERRICLWGSGTLPVGKTGVLSELGFEMESLPICLSLFTSEA